MTISKLAVVLGLGAAMTFGAVAPSSAFVGSATPLLDEDTSGIGATDVHYRRWRHRHWRPGWHGYGYHPGWRYGYRPGWRYGYAPYHYYRHPWSY